MKVKAKAMGSLIIKENSAPAATDVAVTIALAAKTEEESQLIDCTHDFSVGTTTGLKTLENVERRDIPVTTGVYTGDTFVEAANDTENKIYYYVDYTVVIASRDAALTGQDLTATLTEASGTPFADAVAVDFYVGSVSDSNFKGTAYAAASNNTAAILDNQDIPAANGSAGIKVIMRVYIDGAKASVYTNNYKADAMSFDVSFEAEDNA